MDSDEQRDMMELKSLLAVIGTAFIAAIPAHVLAVLWSYWSERNNCDWLPVYSRSAKEFDEWYRGRSG